MKIPEFSIFSLDIIKYCGTRHHIFSSRQLIKTAISAVILAILCCACTLTTVDSKTNSDEILDSVTYANIGFKEGDPFSIGKPSFYPLSCVHDGVQILTGTPRDRGDNGLVNYVLSNAPSLETLDLIDVKELMFADDHLPSYGFDWIATTGDWDMFPEKVAYTSYDLECQPDEPEWIEYFQGLLDQYIYTESPVDSPVIITDSWAFQWNGIETVAVTATNAFITNVNENGYDLYTVGEDSIIPESIGLPSNDTPAIYLMSALFRAEEEPIQIGSRIRSLSRQTDLTAPQEIGEKYTQFISVAQYNDSNKIVLYPVYCNMGNEESLQLYLYPPEYLLCDLDGDSCTELTVYHRARSSLYSQCSVYRLINNVPVISYQTY